MLMTRIQPLKTVSLLLYEESFKLSSKCWYSITPSAHSCKYILNALTVVDLSVPGPQAAHSVIISYSRCMLRICFGLATSKPSLAAYSKLLVETLSKQVSQPQYAMLDILPPPEAFPG